MEIFFSVAHDPTQLDRQGPDVGTQYRSAIFYVNDAQKRDAEAHVAQLTKAKTFQGPIVTQISQLRAFYAAEEYHQDFAEKHPLHPYILIHDRPKVAELKRRFPELYREVTKTAAR
jgi:peptide-methionine (S)-S-oxide reductase